VFFDVTRANPVRSWDVAAAADAPLPDADLVAGLRAGEPAAFDAAYELHSGPIYRFLTRLCGVPLADDLFQETWLRLARHGRALRPDTNLRAWLYTVARNLARSHARWAGGDAAAVAAVARWWYLPGPGASPHDAAVAADAAARLRRAFERLPAPSREILLLVAGEGLAVDEAARVLDLQPEAARQRLHRARAALAAALPEEDER
jgi:RNA polymerase sigma-70 factor (ECF subfamily)